MVLPPSMNEFAVQMGLYQNQVRFCHVFQGGEAVTTGHYPEPFRSSNLTES